MPNIILGNLENNDSLFEAFLRQAVIINHQNEMAAIPPRKELEKMYAFSNEHNLRMKKLFAADKRQETFAVVIKCIKVAVIAACVSATMLFFTLLTSADFRKAVGDVIVTWFDKFTEFRSSQGSEDFTERDWSPKYLPEGFTLVDTIGTTGFMFTNTEEVRIIFNYKEIDSSTSVDNEDMKYSVIVEDEIIYHLFETIIKDDKYEDNVIVWDMDGYRFTVMGNYNIDELVKIALSVN
ncbi:MAG: DUF4367 domain-containing protein [Oscillospiraceae bacterium]|nr:DUF4367 domain-containing protein [Oscillospiraceae bacterium]